MMNTPDYSQPPRDLPVYVRYLLGLSSDATAAEINSAWLDQVVPLINSGPKALFERESIQLVAAGIPGTQAIRLFKGTRRGKQLIEAMDREGRARARALTAKPPFVPQPQPIQKAKTK